MLRVVDRDTASRLARNSLDVVNEPTTYGLDLYGANVLRRFSWKHKKKSVSGSKLKLRNKNASA